jgi:FixH
LVFKRKAILHHLNQQIMKFNWGTGIALVYATFALGMVGVVFASRKHDPGLVQKDYYALDLNYQNRLEGKQNTAVLPAPPVAIFDRAANTLSVKLPAGMESADGAAKFFRSTTTRDDFSTSFKNGAPIQVSTEKMASGRWHIEMEWSANGKQYFWETAVAI